MIFRYAPGSSDWVGLVADGRALLIGGGASRVLIDALWRRMGNGAPGLLEHLTAEGLQATPPFALIEPADEGLRVIVRGPATVTVGGESVTGGTAATWIERILPSGPIEVDTAASDRTGETLPLVHGVVAMTRLISDEGGANGSVSGSMVTFHSPVPRVETAPPASPTIVSPVSPAAEPSPEVLESTIVHEGLDLPSADSGHTITVSEADSYPVAGSVPGVSSASAEDAEQSEYDYLFGATVYRSVHDAAVEPESTEQAAEPVVTAGDHDGETMFVSKLDRIRGRGTRGTRGTAVTAVPDSPPAPVVVLPTGATHPLDTPLVLGRAPSVSGVPAADLPRLVPLTGGDQDLSRNHVRIEVQGGTVVVTDLNSKNGTTVTLPGTGPVRLRGGEPTPVIAGTAIELGGVITITIEETS